MIVRANNKGQITIPLELRKKFGIKPGTKFVITENGNSIVLKPINGIYLNSLRGSFKGTGVMKAFLAEKKRERELENRLYITSKPISFKYSKVGS